MPTKAIPGLRPTQFKLDDADRSKLDAIAAEASRRDGSFANRSRLAGRENRIKFRGSVLTDRRRSL